MQKEAFLKEAEHVRTEKKRLQDANLKIHQEADNAEDERDSVSNAFIKLDEVRVMLNRLMGP
jgi:hypothetical protein